MSRWLKSAYGKLWGIVLNVALSNNKRLSGGYTMKALDIAGYFVSLANNTPEHDLTNLKLQKLLYYAQGKYLVANNGNTLFDDKVEAWQYGPVINDVYHAFKQCGNFPVTVFDVSYRVGALNDQTKEFINKIWREIGEKYSGSYLVTKTHANGTPWKRLYNESDRNIEIPTSMLRQYFTSHNL
jgi:uncharacterized phage-associated protein